MTKTVEDWTEQQRSDLIIELISLINTETTYETAEVIDLWVVGSYCWGIPTADSDLDIYVEVHERNYNKPNRTRVAMADGKRCSLFFRDGKKTPKTFDKHMQIYDLSKFSLFNDQNWHIGIMKGAKTRQMWVGVDDERFTSERG